MTLYFSTSALWGKSLCLVRFTTWQCFDNLLKAAHMPLEIHGSNQIIPKVMQYGRDFLTLLIKTRHQMDGKKGVMAKPITLIANLHRFVLPTKMTLSMNTNVSEVCYVSSIALSLRMGLAQFLWVQCSTGWRNFDRTLVYAHQCQITVTFAKSTMRRFHVVNKYLPGLSRVGMQLKV